MNNPERSPNTPSHNITHQLATEQATAEKEQK